MDLLSENNTEAAQRRKGLREAMTQPATPAAQPSLQIPYYIERPGITHHTASGIVVTPALRVPLIAADQLPWWINVVGVPRVLNREQAEDMCGLGVISKGQTHKVRITQPDAPPRTSGAPRNRLNPTAKSFASQKDRRVGHMAGDDNDGERRTRDEAVGTDGVGTTLPDSPLIDLHQRPDSPGPLIPPPGNPYPVMYWANSTVRGRGGSAEHPAERLLRACRGPTVKQADMAGNAAPFSNGPRPNSSSSASSSTTAATTTIPTVDELSKRIHHQHSSKNDHNGGGSSCSSNRSSSNDRGGGNSNGTKNARRVSQGNQHVAPARDTTESKGPTHCREWYRRGTCRFGGACRYRHAMQHSARDMRGTGPAAYPPWWWAAAHLRLVSGRAGNGHGPVY